MPVHLYGHPFDVEGLGRLAAGRGIDLYEDAAQAHGASFNGKKVGSFGTFAMFSLYPTKNMTSGEGGMVTTSDAAVEHKLRLLRNQGMEKQYENELVGFNARMTDLTPPSAASSSPRCSAGPRSGSRTRHSSTPTWRTSEPGRQGGAGHVYHQYTIRVPEDRDGLAKALRDEYNIGTGVYYPVPNHRLPSFNRTRRPAQHGDGRQGSALPAGSPVPEPGRPRADRRCCQRRGQGRCLRWRICASA